MTIIFEQQGEQYKMQSDYKLPCITFPNKSNYKFSVWNEQHSRYLKEHHKVRYYNLLTAGMLDRYLFDIEKQAEEMFEKTVNHLLKRKMLRKN